jgi:DNA-directed RNA polymerase beta subunit
MSPDVTLREDLHRASLARFLQGDVAPERREDHGLEGVLRTHLPVTTADGVASLEFVAYALHPPRLDADGCRRDGMTLAAVLKATVRLVIWELPGDGPREIRDVKEQELYFGQVPVLSEDGTLVVDGVDRAPILRLGRAPQLHAVGSLFEEHARLGVAAMVEKARERMERARQRDSVETMMPHDLLDARPLARAWSAMLKKSPFVVDFAADRPLARVSLAWRVRVDADALTALDEGPFAPWLHRDAVDPTRAALAVDAPVNAHGLLAGSDGDRRTLAARLAPDPPPAADPERTLRALTLSSPDAPAVRGALDRAVAARSGALLRASRAGRVQVANDQRVWVVEDGRNTPTLYRLQPRGAPRRDTPFTLRRLVDFGARVEAGDVLAEGAAVAGGTLALGRSCAVARAADLGAGRCRVSSRMREAFRAARIERIEVVTRDTRMGKQWLTREVPGADPYTLRHLDASGLVALGAEVDPGDVLAGVVTPEGAVETAPGVWAERAGDGAVRAAVRGRVVGVDVSARRGVERSARHTALVEAMERDLDAEAAERASCLGDAHCDAAEVLSDEDWERYREARQRLQQGDDLPPGVVQRVVIALLVERDLACGDVLANRRGACWTVEAIVDDVSLTADVALPDVCDGEMYLLRLAPEDPPVSAKRRRAPQKEGPGPRAARSTDAVVASPRRGAS